MSAPVIAPSKLLHFLHGTIQLLDDPSTQTTRSIWDQGLDNLFLLFVLQGLYIGIGCDSTSNTFVNHAVNIFTTTTADTSTLITAPLSCCCINENVTNFLSLFYSSTCFRSNHGSILLASVYFERLEFFLPGDWSFLQFQLGLLVLDLVATGFKR